MFIPPSLVTAAGFAFAAISPPLLVQHSPIAGFSQQRHVKVPVLLGVMSRCPDALICESVFDKVLSQVGDKVDLSLSFIGSINSSEPDFGVTCMHGPEECAGNVQELCAAKYLPQEQWWRYVQCQNYYGRYRVGDPDIALSCAATAKFSWEHSGVGTCAGVDGSGKGHEGIELLKISVNRSVELGISRSCTIMINGKRVCVRDESWKDCEAGHEPSNFAEQINYAYEELNKATPK
ncbi:hypothetical protein BD410DRAFT_45349 [Rickenella mellea]|uniref:Gamma interferon inducible lysosomal thiol reductase GILT n=1 Tax=Rickenella mellea TaxID=50990 RepID=A0A4R5XGG0_9AGAM|nr:hypothetical protein BD410DRAFT_45349 [Rickenella mellea]